jgi:uncharacterized protein YcbK (DUF882 family)
MTWKHFTRNEFACKHCGENKTPDDFIDKLDALREQCGFALPVTSGYRCPEHNSKVSHTGLTGPHTTGRAVDFGVRGDRAYKVMELAMRAGFTGIGLNQKGDARFVHLDDLPNAPGQPRPTCWSY